MAWMETDYSKHTHFSMADKMAAGVFGRARNYGLDDPLIFSVSGQFRFTSDCYDLLIVTLENRYHDAV